MRALLALHVLAGTLGLLAGFVALYSAKGAATHQVHRVIIITIRSRSNHGASPPRREELVNVLGADGNDGNAMDMMRPPQTERAPRGP